MKIKKENIFKILLTVGCITLSVGAMAKIIDLSNSLKNATVEFYNASTIYGDDYNNIIRKISKNADYKIQFFNEFGDEVENPTDDGNYSVQVNINKNKLYNSGVFKKEFSYVNTSSDKVNSYFHAGSDSWGGDEKATSVNCNVNNITSLSSHVDMTINLSDKSSACLDSSWTMFDGTFKILFKTNLSDYGTFAFWLTGFENEQNTKDEVTFELLSNNKAVFGSAKGDDYKSFDKTLDKNYADGYWHALEFIYNHEIPEASVKIDGETIYSFESDNLPNVTYVTPHIGLLYPTNPKWTGEMTDKQVTASVANYEAYKVNGDSQ